MLTTVAFLALTIVAAEAGARYVVREHIATIDAARRAANAAYDAACKHRTSPGVEDDREVSRYIAHQTGKTAAAVEWLERVQDQIGAIRVGLVAALPAAAFARLAVKAADAARLAMYRAEEAADRCGS